MQVETIFDAQLIYSFENGTMKDVSSKPISAAVNAKTVQLFLDIEEVDDTNDIRIVVKWEISADGERWHQVGTLLDTDDGGAGKAKVAVYEAVNSSTEALGAYNRFYMGIELFGTPSASVYAKAALKAVYKPF